MKSASLFLVAFLVVLFSSCEKDATNVKLPNVEPKLVVGCFISPQNDTIRASITLSTPVFGSVQNNSNANIDVTDATISISDNVTSATLTYNWLTGMYELPALNFPIVAEKTYYLSVTTPDGKKATAHCTIPKNIPVTASVALDSLKINYYTYNLAVEEYSYAIRVKWNDIANETNYYRVLGSYVYIDTIFGITSINNLSPANYAQDQVYDDVNFNEGEYSAFFYTGYPAGAGISSLAGIPFSIYVMNIDENYAAYEKFLAKDQYNDPFTEPAISYTNIEGGLGVFAAFQQLKITKQF